ncbi:hypothetical protein GCM10008959_38170 [Deinococcus seoulensis]|uniref:Pyridine nucleotide-disulfide oxidoreductase n=1 Tax=Deinococcus seoulensis TaxID=1837379 RepID=A0ABQ2RZM3_9DEIO|nr:hypothetical protein GCM10008959_38170 [Deinococcus seoulensis]
MAVKTDIVIIGAGQAGLPAAYHLRQRGLPPCRGFVLLDRSPGPGSAWQFRWPTLTLSTAKGRQVIRTPNWVACKSRWVRADASRSKTSLRAWSWQPGTLPDCQRNRRNPGQVPGVQAAFPAAVLM